MALKEPIERDWLSDTIRQTGANLRATDDTALAGRLRAQGLAEVLQAPQRGKPPASGRTKYISNSILTPTRREWRQSHMY
jgi:hypothetical protein